MTTDATVTDLRQLRWRHPAPETLAALLESLGCAVVRSAGGAFLVDFGGGRAEIVATSAAGERLEAVSADTDWPPASPEPMSRLEAIALGTVDRARWSGHGRQTGAGRVVGDRALGGEGFVASEQWPRLLVLEPVVEGRLAAALARFDEGPVALYLTPRPGWRPTQSASDLEPARPWPLGSAARLVTPARPWGPFLFVVTDNQGEAADQPGA